MSFRNIRRNFKRSIGKRSYKRLFLISSEGKVTEPEYFFQFNTDLVNIQIKCLNSKDKSSPKEVLNRVRKYLKDNKLHSQDEAWLIVDRDQWKVSDLNELFRWSKEKENYGLALSFPKFEIWLLLHFEDSSSLTDPKNCSERLEKYISDYKKSLKGIKFTKDMIKTAINRAKQLDNPPCHDWPKKKGSTVYKIVEKIIKL
jgi:hypothetical protein